MKLVLVFLFSLFFGLVSGQDLADINQGTLRFFEDNDTVSLQIDVEISSDGNVNEERSLKILKIGSHYYYNYGDFQVILQEGIKLMIDHKSKVLSVQRISEKGSEKNISDALQEIGKYKGKNQIKKINEKEFVIYPSSKDIYNEINIKLDEDKRISKLSYLYGAKYSGKPRSSVKFSYGVKLSKLDKKASRIDSYILLKGKNLITTPEFRGYEIVLQD